MAFTVTLAELLSFLRLAAIPLVLGGIVTLYWTYFQSDSTPLRRLPYPPGPPPKGFLSGNLSDVPVKKPWVTYADWAKTYGDIIHIRIYNQNVIILNSIDVVKDLIETRSNIYSDRPYIPMINLMNWDFVAGFKLYGPEWRIHRRLFQESFRSVASLAYRPAQTRKVNDMLYGILTSPEDFMDHCKTVAAASIMSIMYGHDISPKVDYYVTLSETAVRKLGESTFPGVVAVNSFPLLRHIPAWFPGAGFKRFGDETKILTHQMQEVPFDFVVKKMAEETATPCVLTQLLSNPRFGEVKREIREMTATGYAAGADTTSSALCTFFNAMTMYPGVQEKAQEEIDLKIGRGRLVTYEDRDSLPFVEALYREVMRWRVVLPLSLPHSTTKEDVYRGYYIPKGATILINIWALSHDSNRYPQPELFNPDRYFDEMGNLTDDEVVHVFGSGRRICPGRHMADATIWLAIATTLSTFNIQKKKDVFGNDIRFQVDYTDTLISHPAPFECLITPRSVKAEQLILEATGRKS